MDTCLPTYVMVGDVRYVREDVAQQQPVDRWYTVAELEELTGWSKTVVNAAIRRHELIAVAPNGGTRYRRVRWSDFTRWIESMRSTS